jgi:endonuclease/exonuclease/phosphatase family metal-dependent hydrolase
MGRTLSSLSEECGRFWLAYEILMQLTGRSTGSVARLIIGALACFGATEASAQLRIVSYNTLTGENPGVQTARPTAATVLEAIGLQSVNGITKPIDVMLLQEQYTTEISTQSFVDVLNSIYGAGTYARSTVNALTSHSERLGGAPAMLYNTQTVSLIAEQRFGTVNGSNQARSAMRYQLRPVGYDATADFYAYSNHYKAGSTTDDKTRRNIEAVAVRNNANALGEGAHLIFAGDFNIQSSGEAMYQTLLAPGAGQANDPLNASETPTGLPVTWLDNSAYRSIHTQNPAGPMDDRFDFQLVSGEMLDGEGMSIIPDSYRAFGNNGTHSLNGAITTGTGASAAVLTALRNNSDHLPVVADYQIPAMMGVELATMPTTVTLGASISVGVTISNIANVAAVIGADELDYTLSVSGDLFGGATGIDFALGGGNVHQVGLNTATPGMKSGVVTVSSISQGAAHALQTFPVSFEVLAPFLAADFDEDGFVDGDDLTTWKTNYGLASGATKTNGDANLDGVVDGADFLLWQRQFNAAGNVLASSSVPEPGAATMLVAGFALLFQRRRVSI